MNRIAVILAAAFFLICIAPLHGQTAPDRPSVLLQSESPDKSLALSLEKNQQNINELRLISLKGNSVSVDFPLSDAVKSWSANQVHVSSIIWTSDNSAVALMIGNGRNGEAYACAKMTDGVFKAVNLTDLVRGAHLGVLGRPMSDFVRSEHAPVKWGEWTAEFGYVIDVRSHFWDKNSHRYTIKSPFIVGNNGGIGGQ
jgi:hypothetical protein